MLLELLHFQPSKDVMSLRLSVQIEGLGNLLQPRKLGGQKWQEEGEELFLPLTLEGLEVVGEPWSWDHWKVAS